MNRPLCLALAAAISSSACSKVVVVPVPHTATLKGEGVFYALPKTVARVLVKANKESSTSARYARFAPIFVPGAKPPCGTITKCAALKGGPGKSAKYSLQQGAVFTTFGEPDPSQVFMVKFTGGGAFDQSLSMAWNEAGLLSTASASVTNRTIDIVTSGTKLVTGLVAKGLAGSVNASRAQTAERCPVDGDQAVDKPIIAILLEVDPEPKTNALVANYCDLPLHDRVQGTDENSRDDFTAEDREALWAAVGAYKMRVWPIINQRSTLLTSTSLNVLEPDKYLDKLDPLIDEQLKGLFIGGKSTATWELPFEVRSLAVGTPVNVLGLDESNGVCPTAELVASDAKPMPDDFQAANVTCTEMAALWLAYHPAQTDQLFSRVQAGTEPETGDRSFRYVLPAQVKAQLTFKKDNYGTAVFSVAQLGHVVSLPAKRHSKTIAYDLAMIEATGGLKSFKLGTTGGLDAATIDAFAAAGGTALDARNAELKEARDKRDKAETAADEVAILTRQQTILKLKDEICELQKKYGLACTVQQ